MYLVRTSTRTLYVGTLYMVRTYKDAWTYKDKYVGTEPSHTFGFLEVQ